MELAIPPLEPLITISHVSIANRLTQFFPDEAKVIFLAGFASKL